MFITDPDPPTNRDTTRRSVVKLREKQWGTAQGRPIVKYRD